MNCPKCAALIPAANVNIQALVGKCEQCNEVFRVTDVLPAGVPPPDGQPVRVPRPSTLLVHDEGDARAIRQRWFHPMYLGLLIFCIAWDSFLVFWYSMALFGPIQNGVTWIALIFPIGHVAVGVSLTYVVIAGFLNKSYLGVTADRLYVRHRPVPWFGNRDIAIADLREVYIEHISSHRGSADGKEYLLSAVVEDGKRIKLLGGLNLPEAQFIAQQLNEWVRLPPSRLGVSLSGSA